MKLSGTKVRVLKFCLKINFETLPRSGEAEDGAMIKPDYHRFEITNAELIQMIYTANY